MSVAQCAKKNFVPRRNQNLDNKKHSTKLNSNSVIVDTYFVKQVTIQPFSLSGGSAYISRSKHVLWVDESPEQPH